MHSPQRHIGLVRLTCALALLIAANVVNATAYLQSLAWSRYFPSYAAVSTVDTQGNTYLIVATESGSSQSGTLYVLDRSGNVTSSNGLFGGKSNNYYPRWIGVVNTPTVKQLAFVYTSGGSDNEVLTTVQCDFSGQPSQTHTTTAAPNPLAFLGASIGADGTAFVALGKGTQNALETDIYGPTGTVMTGTDPNVQAYKATFSRGTWVTNGFNLDTVPVWAIYSAAGQKMTGGTLKPLDNGKDTYKYLVSSTADSLGNAYLAYTVFESDDKTQNLILESHFLRSYSATGALRWASPSYPYGLNAFAVSPSGSNVYLVDGAIQTTVLKVFDGTGHLQTQIPTTFSPDNYPLFADNTGVYYARTNATATTAVIDRFQSGAKVWGASYSTPSPGVGATTFASLTGASPNLYLVTMQPDSSGNYQAIVQRFVSGPALSSITGSSVVAANNSITLRVQLNTPAPSGGLLVKLTTSSTWLRFSGGATTYNLAIPAGSLYGNVTLLAGPVPIPIQVAMVGDQSGVVRAKVIVITP